MSIESPEAFILTEQMNKEIKGKIIESYYLQDYERLQKVGFFNKEIKDFDMLLNSKIESVIARGNLIRLKLNNNSNLLIGPEYGGKVLYHKTDKNIPDKFHSKIIFTDKTLLTIRLTGMGLLQSLKDSDLKNSYLYKRDFSNMLSPMDNEFTFKKFSESLKNMKRGIKSLLVGKDAIVVGLSNSAFQDIIYRAKLFPKIKGIELNEQQIRALYESIKKVVSERVKLGGKYQFIDLYGKKGQYIPSMGPNMGGKSCPECGSNIEKISVGGGQIYYCPDCQMLKD